jgi:hypothetical protein
MDFAGDECCTAAGFFGVTAFRVSFLGVDISLMESVKLFGSS